MKVPPSTRPPVVRLEVTPELFADALGRIIADRGLAVIPSGLDFSSRADDQQQPAMDVDVVVVSGQAPVDRAAARVVLWVPEGQLDVWDTATEVVVGGPRGHESVLVAGLDDLVDLIVELAIAP